MKKHRIIWHNTKGGGQLTTSSVEDIILKIREVIIQNDNIDIIIYTIQPEQHADEEK